MFTAIRFWNIYLDTVWKRLKLQTKHENSSLNIAGTAQF